MMRIALGQLNVAVGDLAGTKYTVTYQGYQIVGVL